MKKFIALFATIAVAISLAGCSSDESNPSQETAETYEIEQPPSHSDNHFEMTPEMIAYYEEQDRKHAEVMAKLTDESIEKIITKKFFLEQLLNGNLNREFNPAFSFQRTPVSADELFKIELLRQMSRERMYAMYQVEEGGLFYAFFDGGDIPTNGGILYNYIYVMKSLETKDFSALQIGDDISLVNDIDPIVTLKKDVYDKKGWDFSQTKHLLRDGLLVIDYRKTEDGSYIIVNMNYYDDFKFIPNFEDFGFDDMNLEHMSVVYDYSILESDYPQSIG